ncbi:MAG: hypothetical protein WA709_06390 [Stellaceae bacterium]
MISATTAKAPLHQRAMHELKEVVFITLSLRVSCPDVLPLALAVKRRRVTSDRAV